MDNSVNDCISEHIIAKDSSPLFKVSVRGKDDGLLFISGSDNFKEVIDAMLWDFAKAEFINDEQVSIFESCEDSLMGAVGSGGMDFFDQGVGMRKDD